MRFSFRSKLSILLSLVAALIVVSGVFATSAWLRSPVHAAQATATHPHIDCSTGDARCVDIADSDRAFGHYVGHDEPSNLFYSNVPGSGNRNSWQLTLPKDPTPTKPLTPGKSYNFELHPAFWFGMAMCDTQSYPELLSTCTPDSDKNIVDPAVNVRHAGTAFMEMQFYPPGWVQESLGPSGSSCDATRWCAAMNIDSYQNNPVTNQFNNPACIAAAGVETVNFAIITKSGVAQAPASPMLTSLATLRPDPKKALFMNSGDRLTVTMHDTAHGLNIQVNDATSGQSGSMTASAANGFAHVLFDPNGTNCDLSTHNLPYDFHPMYSTSSEKTGVLWSAHTYNIAFSDEIGHFDFCNGPNAITPQGPCPSGNTEGPVNDPRPTDTDDIGCFPASSSLRIQVSGCTAANGGQPPTTIGFDGASYQQDWPDGNTKLHPTSILFSSPLTGASYNVNYNRMAFETDLPVEEFVGGNCNLVTGVGCTPLPITDLGTVAAFYPFFSIRNVNGQCRWQLGNHIPGSKNDFGQNAQYGTLITIELVNPGGSVISIFQDFRQVFSKNPCLA